MSLMGMSGPDAVHEKLCCLRDARAELAYELGRWLLAGQRLRLHVSFGYASFGEYGEWLFGMSRREVRERLRTAEALESLPEMAEALRTGALCWSVVRELTRVADEETEEAWIAAASGRTARAVEGMVRCHRKGDRPTDLPIPDPPKRITMEVSASTWALFEEMKAELRARQGRHVSDDELVQEMAGAVLCGGRDGEGLDGDELDGKSGRDEGRAAFQIALTICDNCRTATETAGGEEVVVDQVRVEQACCDAQHLGRVDIETPGRATQDVPSRVRRAVIRRHGKHCAVPGCRNASFKQLHHLERRADGGGHDPDNLIPLCGTHHTAAHVGSLVIRGQYSTGLTFEHADGTRYGSAAASPSRLSALATVLEILVGMGFKQREAQGMVDRIRDEVGDEPEVEAVLRAALQRAPTPGFAGVREEPARYERLSGRNGSGPHACGFPGGA